MVDHISGVRKIPGLENATVVLQLESNLAFECQHIIHTLTERGVKKWVCLSEGTGGTIGWLTTNERKEVRLPCMTPRAFLAHSTWNCRPLWRRRALSVICSHDSSQAMCFQMRDALRVGNIFLSKHLFSVLLEGHEIVKTIRDELCRFAIVTEPAKTLFGKIRRTYTGKLGGLNDDLAICLQLCITGLRCFYQSEKYATFRPEY